MIATLLLCSHYFKILESDYLLPELFQELENFNTNVVQSLSPNYCLSGLCRGLFPIKIPMQMMKSCYLLLQEHSPNHLGEGDLFVILLPKVLNVTDVQSFIQSLEPATWRKLKIKGKMYHKVL
ncbi:hypothetical protein HN51_069258 [Arachis hypogaea]